MIGRWHLGVKLIAPTCPTAVRLSRCALSSVSSSGGQAAPDAISAPVALCRCPARWQAGRALCGNVQAYLCTFAQSNVSSFAHIDKSPYPSSLYVKLPLLRKPALTRRAFSFPVTTFARLRAGFFVSGFR